MITKVLMLPVPVLLAMQNGLAKVISPLAYGLGFSEWHHQSEVATQILLDSSPSNLEIPGKQQPP
jgi:hypothetical protein